MKRRFELVEGKSAKFWEVEVAGGRMTVRYGRIGTPGQTKEKELGEGASAAAEKLIAEKTKKGYREIGGEGAAAARPATGIKRKSSVSAASDNAKELAAVIARLDEALAAYAPKRHAALRPARRLSKLEKMIAVPAELRTLWAWADGGEELLVPSARDLDAAVDLLGASQAAEELAMLRKAAALPDGLCPFAADGAGNFLVLATSGEVLDWDHETRKTRKVAASLSALLGRTEKALNEELLFGGPEPEPGKVDKRVVAAEKLIARPINAKAPSRQIIEVLEATTRLDGREAYRLRKLFVDKLLAAKVPKSALERLYTSFAFTAAQAGEWKDALAALAARGKVYDPHDSYKTVGRIALEAGALEAAGKAFAKGSSLGALVGRAVVAKLIEADAKPHMAKAEKEIEEEIAHLDAALKKDEAAGRKAPNPDRLDFLSTLYVHRATIEKLAGDGTSAATTLREARARCGQRTRGTSRVTLDAFARAAGLS
jgi:predicted DNA-binding WGR domain protein